MTSSVAPTGWVPVPPVAAIDWIPYYFSVDDVPANNYTLTRRKVYDYLFDSGNRDPDDNLGDEPSFLQIVNSHDYRGAFFLDGLKLYRTSYGFTEHSRDFRRMEYVGYMPIRYIDRGTHPPIKYSN